MSEPDIIIVKGAREHNLKSVTLEIPKKKLVVFTGVSGLGQVARSRSTRSTPRGSAATSSRLSSLRAPVPRADGEAQVRHHPRALADHLHRAEGRLEQPALDRRHDHRGPRLPARALRVASACSTAPRAAARWASRRRSRSSTRSSQLPARTRASSCSRRSSRTARASTGSSSSTSRSAASRASASTAMIARARRAARARQEAEARHRARGRSPRREGRDRAAGSPTRSRPRCARARARSSSRTPTRSRRSGRADPEEYKKHDRFFSELNACPPAASPSASSRRRPSRSTPRSAVRGLPRPRHARRRWTRTSSSPTRRSPSARARSSRGRAGWSAARAGPFEFVEHLARALKIDLDLPWAKLPEEAPRRRPLRHGGTSTGNAPLAGGCEFEGVVEPALPPLQGDGLRGDAALLHALLLGQALPHLRRRAAQAREPRGAHPRQGHRRAVAADHRRTRTRGSGRSI